MEEESIHKDSNGLEVNPYVMLVGEIISTITKNSLFLTLDIPL